MIHQERIVHSVGRLDPCSVYGESFPSKGGVSDVFRGFLFSGKKCCKLTIGLQKWTPIDYKMYVDVFPIENGDILENKLL